MAQSRSSPEVLQWLSELSNLARQEAITCKQNKGLESSKFCEEEAASIRLLELEWARELAQEKRRMSRQLRGLREASQHVQRVIARITSDSGADDEPTTALAAELQKRMEALQLDLGAFKSSMRTDYEKTVFEERALSREVEDLAERFNGWAASDAAEDEEAARRSRIEAKRRQSTGKHQQGAPRTASKTAASSRRKEEMFRPEERRENLRKKIRAIDDMVARSGGASGGWHPTEHSFFLAAWTQALGVGNDLPAPTSHAWRRLLQAVKERCLTAVPNRSSDEVEGHASWWAVRLRRLEEKRLLVEEWRADKRREGASSTANTEEQQQQQPEVSSISDRAPEEDAATKEAKRVALEEWRQRKRSEAERAAAEEERSRQESVEAQLRLKQEHRAKKEAVALFKLEKEQRQQHEAQIKQVLEGQAKTKYNASEQRERRAAGFQAAKARHERAAQASRAKTRPEPMPPPPPNVARDPSRVYQGTDASAKKALSATELDMLEEKRSSRGAHQGPVALGAYDLQRGTGTRARTIFSN